MNIPVDRYPDREAIALRRALSHKFNIDPNRIVVGNGTSELIQLIAFAYLERGEIALVLSHTFGEYQRAIALMGAQIREFGTKADDGFQVDAEGLERELAEHPAKMFFLCNPNNPTGTFLEAAFIEYIVKRFPQTLFVVDEAYIQFSEAGQSMMTARAENLVVMRSMTKDYSLAGLRLGYAAGSMPVIEALSRVRPAWNVNAVAQAAGLAALQDEDYFQESLTKLRIAKQELWDNLVGLGADLVPSATHYWLVKVGNGGSCRSELIKQRIQVRDCFSFDLPAYIRIATKTPRENGVLVAALQDIQQKRGSLVF